MNDIEWLIEKIDGIKDTHDVMSVSEYAESVRYMPPSVTAFSGDFSFDVAPFFREIADCMSQESPVRVVSLMKGAQVGATVSLLENAILYCIGHLKTCPIMALIADSEMAKIRVEENIMTMLVQSNLDHLIQSNEGASGSRKTGKNKDKISFEGGGFLFLFGANNPAKLRSFSIQYLLIDEPDGFKRTTKDGDPITLAITRTSGYSTSRKICLLSTPTTKEESRINEYYEMGDKRHFYVPCKKCGFEQVLEWNKIDKKTGVVYGLIFAHNDGVLDVDSVRYVCKNCHHRHKNSDKNKIFGKGYWKPTCKPSQPSHRSYHLSALYAPIGNKSWESIVYEWFECWDVVKNKAKDISKLQVFYNNNLGLPFAVEYKKLKMDLLCRHIRKEYNYGEVPNGFALHACGHEISLLTCAVDVHKDNLAVAVFGWARGSIAFLIDYFLIEDDDCMAVSSNAWRRLADFLENKKYISKNGYSYEPIICAIDVGYEQSVVMSVCMGFKETVQKKVIHIKGDGYKKGSDCKQFSPSLSKVGRQTLYMLNVNMYKERWHASLLNPWSKSNLDQCTQHDYCFNSPDDVTADQLKQLTMEKRVPKTCDKTGAFKGYGWDRPSGSKNELWDLLVYNNAALDILAWDNAGRKAGFEWSRVWGHFDRNYKGKIK